MFRSVVGLDIGASAVKAIVLRGGLRALQVGQVARVAEAGIPLSERLVRLTAATPLRADDVLTALPGNRVAVRLLTFPAAAAKQLDKVVPFELETHIPFTLDQVAVAHQRTTPPGGPEVTVLAAAAPVGDLAQLLDACAVARLDPRGIDVDTAALAPLAVAVPGADPDAGATVVVDLGATKTGVCVVADGRLRYVRTVTGGGQAMTRAVAQALGVGEDEAEVRKLAVPAPGTDGPGAEEGDAAARAAVARTLETLAAELHKTLVAYRQTGGPEVGRLLLVGGGAAQAGIAGFLERALEIPARVVRPADVPGLGGAAESLGPEFTPALALALSGSGRRLPPTLNFRRGPFAYRREMAGLRRQVAVSVGLAAAILIILGMDFYTEYSAKVTRYEAVQAQVREAYRAAVPDGPLPANEALDLRARTEALRKELAQIGGLAGGRLTPLAILAELSQRVPRDVRIDVLELVVEKSQIRMRAETDSFESVDRIKAELLQFEPITDIQVSDARVNANQTSVGFRFTIALRDEV